MVGLEILVKIQPEKRFEFLQAFELLTLPENKHQGCIEQTLLEKASEPNVFAWQEDWKDETSLNAYRQSQRFRCLIGAVEVLGSLIKIRKISSTEE